MHSATFFAPVDIVMRHTIYVPRDASHPETLQSVGEALRIADWAAPYVNRRGHNLTVWRVRTSDLSNSRVLAAFRSRGILSLPALIAGKEVLIGCSAIEHFYRGVVSGASDQPESSIGMRVAPRNRGRPYLGPSTSTSAVDASPSGVDNSGTDSLTGEDILAEFYGDEAAAFKGGAVSDHEFGTAVS